MAKATSIASSDHNERFEPRILRAAETDNADLIERILKQARDEDRPTESLLRIALARSSEKGTYNSTVCLLKEGADPNGTPGDNRLSPLLRAVERSPPNQLAICQALLRAGANKETKDKKGRTALMTAAWRGNHGLLDLLLRSGADPNGRDNRMRNVLHNLAASHQSQWGDSVVDLLLAEPIDIHAKDILGRTALHWACATGKVGLARKLLERPKPYDVADVDAREERQKTSLHLAAFNSRSDVVDLLLMFDAAINARSDGNWSPLHNAAEKGSADICLKLLEHGADINAKLDTGATPLHYAAQYGHLDVVKVLCQVKGIRKGMSDTFGLNPFLRAAQNHHKDIVDYLAPSNNAASLSSDAIAAYRQFNATIVDFGEFRNLNRVRKMSVFDVIYGRDATNPRKAAFNVLPQEDKAKGAVFRWIHLPANNIAWVESLLAKWFVEEDAYDINGFGALEKNWSHVHRGKQSHSQFMRPLCQSTPREVKPQQSHLEVVPKVTVTPKIVIAEPSDRASPKAKRIASATGIDRLESPKGVKSVSKKEDDAKVQRDTKRKAAKNKNDEHEKHSNTRSRAHSKPEAPKAPVTPAKKNICLFMPYLHYETTTGVQNMQSAIKRTVEARELFSPRPKATCADELLFRAHLLSSSTSLHVRRTLDQSYYFDINTERRDADQVVFRYQQDANEDVDGPVDPKIYMVDQLWMWVLGKDLVITSFPQRWNKPRNDTLDVLEGLIEDINSKTREPVESVYDLATIITARCSGLFDRHRFWDENYQFLNMFESSIGRATDKETDLFQNFDSASSDASAWLRHHRSSTRLFRFFNANREKVTRMEQPTPDDDERTPRFVDALLDIGKETELLKEIKDIRDELNMISKILDDQRYVIPDLGSAILDIFSDERKSQQDMKKRFEHQVKLIDMHLHDISRMDKQAERIYKSITDMLDLKQKYTNTFEARFARDQATDSNRQSQTVMVFTLVTIVFLPLSFIAAFFTINIQEFPGQANSNDSNNGLPLAYVSKYMFGIGFAISIPLILIALSLDDISAFFAWLRRKMKQRSERKKEERTHALEMLRMQRMPSDAKTKYTVADDDWAAMEMDRIRVSRDVQRRSRDSERRTIKTIPATGFRIRESKEIQRLPI